MTAYYNEIDSYAAQWLRNLIAKNLIAPGDVDERSIVDVQPDDLKGYTQCHFFAGIGGWSYAARLAGYPDDRELWTGSEPCQPYSVAGKCLGEADERYLRPHVHRLIAARRPRVYMGEQVAAAAGKDWLDRVHTDMESIRYSCWSVVVPACAVDTPHRRDRLWFVADAENSGRREECEVGCRNYARNFPERVSAGSDASRARQFMADPYEPCESQGREQRSGQFGRAGCDQEPRSSDVANTNGSRSTPWISAPHGRREGITEVSNHGSNRRPGPWGECDWIEGADGKARRVEPGIRLLAHGVPARVGKLRAYGNAIVPQLAAEVIGAYMEIAA
ncbi:DNA cytosine methyltransferase [Agrobacterium salinitolerans]|uniref:DNA cytosine methyltransferase n=1 Tax=Agrobacterium salinitolerans TaxID=1183413 RepID=UPI0022B83BB1|nr:DNA cytosine methyltransferase [Agrobacterium salinitolerans]MCZ7974386.1 DNA cytosine methyltransferase [Agrobacterium salinitolerans]